MLGVSKLTLRNWDNKGILKAVRMGSRGDRRYRKTDVERFLKPVDQGIEINKNEFEDFLKKEMWTEEAPGLPLTLERAVDKMVDIDKYFKPGITHCVFYYFSGMLKQYLSVNECIEACKGQIEALHTYPQEVRSFFAECKKQFQSLESVVARLNFLDFSKLSNAQLQSEFQTFDEALATFWSVTLVVEPFAPFIDIHYLPKFEKEVGDTKKAREAFYFLSLPSKLSFISQEHRDLLQIVTRYLRSKTLQSDLAKMPDADFLAHISIEQPDLLEALLKHQRQYFWVQNSYGQTQVLSIQSFLGFIRDMLKEQSISELEKELKTLINVDGMRRDQELLEEKLHLSESTRKELEFLREVVWIKDERKKHVLKMLHVMYLFMQQYAKRSDLPQDLIGLAKIEELSKFLSKELGRGVLEGRANALVHVSQKGGRSSYIAGNEAILIRDKINAHPEEEGKDTIHGTIACKGKDQIVQGTVKIVLDPRNEDIGPDDILVTSMTRPDFMPLMRKAKAVITDEGGITCHAAIVSREMNKPCIIGTRRATRVLKNGERIEMRMNHGLIKPLVLSK